LIGTTSNVSATGPTLTTQPTVSAAATHAKNMPTTGAATCIEQKQISVPTPSTLKNKSMEEILNTWNKDLNSRTREFHKQAAQVAEWDKQLIENGTKVLYMKEKDYK
jgi:nuclear pore complex protein Nup62